MAQGNDSQTSQTLTSEREPQLRPGRRADPAPLAEISGALPSTDTHEVIDESENESRAADLDSDSVEPITDVLSEKVMAETRQRHLRRLLKQCERVLLLDFSVLAMQDWPDNFTLVEARRRRDIWLFCATLAALVFLSGMTGFVPAWIAGGGFGIFVLIVIAGIPTVRRLYASRPSYLELLIRRQSLMKDARKHVMHLEGEVGLLWQCAQMAEFNSPLKSIRFSGLVRLSEQRVLARSLVKREHMRLYLIYLLEAEKAYDRLQHAYFEGHQGAIDRGWQSVAGASDVRD
ncbi:MAG: hypothetical protein WD623_13415 [Marinobacter sp.]|uniref:hypothetical protein n=1 Tax=Marinobacter sp. TaxID=50741 RepID=UPI0034A0037E